MRRILVTMMIALATAYVGCTHKCKEKTTTLTKTKHISWTEINNETKVNIIGELGFELGTIVRIKGEILPEGFINLKAEQSKTFIKVGEVNSEKLSEAVIIWIKPWYISGPKIPKAGEIVEYIGYEHGQFRGIPDGTFEYVESVQTTGYHFGSVFVALKKE
jgi:hypothetical protein